jgi:DNA transposition AAA+ family ATPase
MSTDKSTHGFSCDQPYIPTSEVQRCMKHVNEWRKTSEQFSGSLGLVSGEHGIGKTVALQNALLKSKQEPYAPHAFVTVRPAPTRRGLLTSICDQLGLSSRGCSSYDMVSKLRDSLQQGQPPLLVLDDADYFLDRASQFKSTSLDILFTLVVHTSCFVLLVGTPKLIASLKMVPQLDCRLGLTHHFGLLPASEMYEVFFPQMRIPGWEFHPTKDEDLQVGKYLWESTRPSLRRVCMVLNHASYLAQMHGLKQITFEEISMALKDLWRDHQG